MRAARRPGIAATRLASTSAPIATIAIDSVGTVGLGTAEISRANSVQSRRPATMPTGTPTMVPSSATTDACDGDGGRELTAGEPERLQEREVAPPAAHGGHEREGERQDRADREPGREEDRGAADGAVVHDLRRALNRHDRDVVAGGFRVGVEILVGDVGDALQVGATRGRARRPDAAARTRDPGR